MPSSAAGHLTNEQCASPPSPTTPGATAPEGVAGEAPVEPGSMTDPRTTARAVSAGHVTNDPAAALTKQS
jgi:hypothetical protein